MKKFLSALIFALIVCTAFSLTVNARTYGDLTYTISNGEITITDCNTSVTSVIIPSEIEGYPVTKIGEEAFYCCKKLTSVKIPDSVMRIGARSFEYCESLNSIVIPNGVTIIPTKAFIHCTSLNEVSIPNSVSHIGNEAFNGCKNLTSITIPSNVERIGNQAFQACSELTSVIFSENSKCSSLGAYAFIWCEKLKSINLPKEIASISFCAFCGCSELEALVLYKNITEIEEGAVSSNVTIYGYTNSIAETYSAENNIPFIALDNTKVLNKSLYLDGGIGVKLHFEYDGEVVLPESLVFNATLTNSKDNSVTQKEVSLTLDTDTNTAYAIVYVPSKDINTVSIGGTLMGETVSGAMAQLDSVSEITVPAYIKELEEKANIDSSYANALDVVQAMETYCDYAEAYFNNTEIEDITFTDAEESAISEIAHPSITNKTLGDIEFYSTSLLLEGTVTLRHYFKVTGDVTLSDYTVEGGSELKLFENSEGYAYIDIENISANELGVQKTVKITNNGETMEIAFSPLNYVKLAYNDDDTALKNLVRALYRYGVKATEYAK